MGLAALCGRGKGAPRFPDVVSVEREVTHPGADAKSPPALGIVWEKRNYGFTMLPLASFTSLPLLLLKRAEHFLGICIPWEEKKKKCFPHSVNVFVNSKRTPVSAQGLCESAVASAAF